MRPRVQTNIQLYQQMRAAGYSADDVNFVHKAYGVAQHLFSARFRPSGMPFLCHLVGTASDLIPEAASADVLAAGLLHAAYSDGDFGYVFLGRKKDSPRKRRWLAKHMGEKVEEYVSRYAHMTWNVDSIPAIHASMAQYDEIQRDVLLIRLANEVDDYRDFGALHCKDPDYRLKLVKTCGDLVVSIASELDYSYLASELGRVFRECISVDLSQLPRGMNQYPYLLPPKSYRRTPALAARNLLGKLRRSLQQTA